jgi:hypothetical protein
MLVVFLYVYVCMCKYMDAAQVIYWTLCTGTYTRTPYSVFDYSNSLRPLPTNSQLFTTDCSLSYLVRPVSIGAYKKLTKTPHVLLHPTPSLPLHPALHGRGRPPAGLRRQISPMSPSDPSRQSWIHASQATLLTAQLFFSMTAAITDPWLWDPVALTRHIDSLGDFLAIRNNCLAWQHGPVPPHPSS